MRLLRAVLILMSLTLVGCGYLDTEVEMTDEEYAGSFGTGGIGIGGVGWGSGCGGGYGYSRSGRGPTMRKGTAEMSEDPYMLEFDDFHIYGSNGAGESTETTVLSPEPEPVDWVGHFDEVSAERQNKLIAAWVEGQLAQNSDSAESSDLVDSGGEVKVR